MANIRKASFNLRNGVQVDEDNLFVNSLGNEAWGQQFLARLLMFEEI